MKILKLSWSDKRKNSLVNFYVIKEEKGAPEVLTMPFSMASADDFRSLLNSQRFRAKQPSYSGPVLHVVLDMLSGRLYLPNMEDISILQKTSPWGEMFMAVKMKAEELAGKLPFAPVVSGDPFSTIRLRKVSDFPSAAAFIAKQIAGTKDVRPHMDLTVVEANMAQMPQTAATIPEFKQHADAEGAYVGTNVAPSISFVVRSGGKDVHIGSVKTPFILLNISPDMELTGADKERLVTTLHKEFAESVESQVERQEKRIIPPEVKAIKYLMYIGWSFRDLCASMLAASKVADFNDLIGKAAYLYNAAKLLARDGYSDPSRLSYYYLFKIGPRFPVRFKLDSVNVPFDVSGQHPILQVIHYDPKTSVVVIKTPLYLDDALVSKLFDSQSDILRCQYDPQSSIIMSDANSGKFEKAAPASLAVVRKDLENFGAKPPEGQTQIPVKDRYLTDLYFERKHVTDFPQAAEIVKKLCKDLSTPERPIQFDDLEVIVGPWAVIMPGMRGGYLGKKSGKIQEPIPGVKIKPPCFIIDNAEYPSAGERAQVIVHEYRHHINEKLWIPSPSYDIPKDMGSEKGIQQMLAYLSSPDERLAHKTQFKYMMSIGMSKDDVLMSLMGGRIRSNFIPIARKYMEIINEADAELRKQKGEEDLEEITKKTLEELDKMDDTDLFDATSFMNQ